MKLLITGSSGYLGKALVGYLSQKDYNISILVREGSLNRIHFEKVESVITIFDNGYVNSIEKFDLIIHCATKYSSVNNWELVESNIYFPISVIKNFLKMKGLFVNIGTALPSHHNKYAYTKRIFKELTKECGDGSFITINLEPEYFFDHLEPPERFIKTLVLNCLNNKDCNLTAGEQVRDFVHLEDVLRAIELILKKSQGFGQYTTIPIGSGLGISIKELALLIKKLTNSDSKMNFGVVPYRENETMVSIADITLLNSIGWFPKYTLEKALLNTIYKISEGTG